MEPLELADRRADLEQDYLFQLGAQWGAMWLTAILGMAEAIRHRYVVCPMCFDSAVKPAGAYWQCALGHYFRPSKPPWERDDG